MSVRWQLWRLWWSEGLRRFHKSIRIYMTWFRLFLLLIFFFSCDIVSIDRTHISHDVYMYTNQDRFHSMGQEESSFESDVGHEEFLVLWEFSTGLEVWILGEVGQRRIIDVDAPQKFSFQSN